MSFSGPTSTSTQVPTLKSAAPSQVRKHRLMNDVDRDITPSPRQSSRAPANHLTIKESIKESKLGSGRDLPDDDSPRLTHPGELVVCKKKRKDREKPTVNTRSGSAGPVSPSSMGRSIRSPGSVSTPREAKSGQQVWSNQSAQQGNGSSSGGTIGWANPVKRLRTDSGKRRPSIM